MLPISNINQEETQFLQRKLERQQQNTIEVKDNQIKHGLDGFDHLGIQMKNENQNEEKIQQNFNDQEDQQKEVIRRNQNENQRWDLNSSSINESQIADEANNQIIQIQILQLPNPINHRDVEIQIDDRKNADNQIVKLGENKQVSIVNVDNNEEQQQQAICLICSLNQYQIMKALECEHQFCRNCYQEYLEDKIKIAKINNIPCLQEGCKMIFSEEIIQQFVHEQKFQQYLVFKKKLEIENDPNKKWCPAKGCNLFIEKDPKTNLINCQCGQIVCFNCGQIAHNGIQCEDAIQIDFKNALVKYQIKYCPKCKSHIQKNSGCNHMTCIQCQFEFCWVCLQPYHQYHYKYWSIRGCAIWSNGRFKIFTVIQNPDKMRKFFFIPRLILYIFRCPLLIIKLILKSISKSFVKPLVGLNKKLCKSKSPKLCLLKCIYYVLAELLILLIVILFFPFYFVFYRLGFEIQKFSAKGCGY
ncbi:unnamed protein product [Paramecium sonneborni]|uniref:RBR-type E3 ubiquitin transferase n=1 Tax=Paramecium sonneborni TaxID=65129 RepID=A0A8S1Q8E1_9CILI|nr:unnamed protein product [Paramecium sonneborni]